MQEEVVAEGERYITPGMPDLVRSMASEGIVLLKNENDTLPLKDNDVVSVFGRCQNDWFYVGYGSGGDVHPPYQVSLMDGLRFNGIACNERLAKVYSDWCAAPEHVPDHGWWGHWPYFHEEMPLDETLVQEAAENSDVAVVVIGRAAGEDRENILEAGSYYLTEKEHKMLRLVCDEFSKVVILLDSGNVMDLSFVNRYPISAVLYVWQLGMESGNAIADVLT
jgi:beta-glucosidase